MHHTTYIFLGKELRPLAGKVCEQVKKNAPDAARDFDTFSWCQGKEVPDIAYFKSVGINGEQFTPDLRNLYEVEQTVVNDTPEDDKQMKAFFLRHYQQRITLGQASNDTKMAFCLVAAGHDTQGVETAANMARCISGIGNIRGRVDVLLLAPDVARLFDESWKKSIDEDMSVHNRTTIENATKLCEAKKDCSSLEQVILIQNCNADKVALGFDGQSMAMALAWFAIANVECDECLHNSVVMQHNMEKVATFGLSCLYFDRYYYLHFMLHHAYLAVMQREGLHMQEVDVNKVADVAQRRLEGKANFFSSFYERHVAAHLHAGKTLGQLTPHIAADLNRFVDDFEHEVMGFLKDDNLSLPEKRAVMAQILLSDDDLLSGSLFNGKQLTFLDLFKEPMAFFTRYNNMAMTFQHDEDDNVKCDNDTNIPVIDHSTLFRPQDDDGSIQVPIDIIKKYRIDIRQASEYIRRMDNEIEAARKQQTAAVVAQQVVVGENFNFENSRFRSAQMAIEEHPLKEKYVPTTTTQDKNVDLTADFTQVKNQGELGACAVFAVTAVMEYILKKNKKLESDFSERFVYYNVREKKGELGQQGAAIFEVIESIGEKGVCSETKCPYLKEHADDKPTQEAYDDGIKHRILKALSIDVSPDLQHNLDVLRTAVAEGYPVIVSMKVFKEMDLGLPFVAMPQEGEEGSNHALVICGFDDETGFFKVRNSWGTKFGDEGYCYMPYAYVAQKQYLNAAYIITEISSLDNVKGVTTKHRISFDSTDTAIRMAILQSLKELKKVQQKQWITEYKQVYADFTYLDNVLKDKTKRDAIVDDAHQLLHERIILAKEQKDRMAMEKGPKIEEHKKTTRRNAFVIGLMAAVFIVLAFVLSWITKTWGAVNLILLAFAGIDLIALVGYLVERRHSLASLRNSLEQQLYQQGMVIGEIEKEDGELDMKAFVAGMMLDSLSNLYNKMGSFNVTAKSYVNNLIAWYEEERQCVEKMSPVQKPPFIALLDNATLERFYQQNEQVLISNIKLSELLEHGNYDINEKSVVQFKNNLKQTIVNKLEESLQHFSVYHFIKNTGRFPFINGDNRQMQQLLRKAMTAYSKIFLVPMNNTAGTQVTILAKQPADCTTQFRQECAPYCPSTPLCENLTLPDALLVIQSDYYDITNISL